METKKNLDILQEQAKKNTQVKPEQNTNPNSDKRNLNILYAIIVLLVVVSGAGWYLYFDLKAENQKTILQLTSVNNEKEEVTSELKSLIVQYEDLKTDNEEVNAKLNAEQERIESLLEELKKVKANNRWQIKKYKKELSTLREIMKSYIYQIDSLNTLNVNLRKENKNVTAENKRISSKNKKLEELTNDLSSTVEKASVLRATNINSVALKRKGRKTNKVKKTEKIKVCFTLAENSVAQNGMRFIYLKITNPDGKVLSGDKNTLEIGEESIQYSDKREIQYENKDLDVCIYWIKSENLKKGEYQVEIISDGYVIGTSSFYLK